MSSQHDQVLTKEEIKLFRDLARTLSETTDELYKLTQRVRPELLGRLYLVQAVHQRIHQIIKQLESKP